MGFFLCLDLLSLPLAFGLRTHGKPLAGILFRPSVHYAAFGNYRPGFGQSLRDVRKDLLYRMMLRRRGRGDDPVARSPFFPAHAADHYRHGGKVQALPDPAHPAGRLSRHRGLRRRHAAWSHRLPAVRLSDGAQGPVKSGLDALRLLPQRIAARVAVLFAGRIDPAIREAIETRREVLAREQPDLWLRMTIAADAPSSTVS